MRDHIIAINGISCHFVIKYLEEIVFEKEKSLEIKFHQLQAR